MAAFLETIARRGAGLGLGGGATLAAPRPRVRFEPGAGSRAGFGDTSLALDAAEETTSHAPVARDAHPRFLSQARAVDTKPLSPARLDPGASFTSYHWKITPASVQPVNGTQMVPPQVRAPRLPLQAPPRPAETMSRNVRQRDSLPTNESTHFDSCVPNLNEGSVPAQPAVVAERVSKTDQPVRTPAPDRGVAPVPAVESARDQVTAATDTRVQEQAPEVVLSLEPHPRHDELHTVSVSIGRIEVEVAPPPTAPAPTQRMQPERTRGFAAYRNARHGRPR